MTQPDKTSSQRRLHVVNINTVDGESPPAGRHLLADVVVSDDGCEIDVYIRVPGKRTRGEVLADVIKAAKGE